MYNSCNQDKSSSETSKPAASAQRERAPVGSLATLMPSWKKFWSEALTILGALGHADSCRNIIYGARWIERAHTHIFGGTEEERVHGAFLSPSE